MLLPSRPNAFPVEAKASSLTTVTTVEASEEFTFRNHALSVGHKEVIGRWLNAQDAAVRSDTH